MKNFILGLIAGVLLVPLAGWLFVVSGGMPVATKSPELPFESYLAHKALHAALAREGEKPSPVTVDEVNLAQGAKIYRTQCAACHGLPGQQATPIAKGMFPGPPQLFQPDEGVDDDPVGKIYWTVKNGVRLTGMPGFVDGLTDTELWQVSLLLSKGKQIPESVTKILSVPAAADVN